jgi:thymidylate synthase ThyX
MARMVLSIRRGKIKDTMNSLDKQDQGYIQNKSSQGPQIVCLTGIDPEVHAYAMAKYSRSSLPMRGSLDEISAHRAGEFLETFYFQYGHRSIADLAHLSFSIEKLTMLAAMIVVDEQRWDGQERSSRYQDFKKSGFYTPSFGETETSQFNETISQLFSQYETLSKMALEYLRCSTPRPDTMPEDSYNRTIRARAFDVARYLLPLATNTSVGQVISARTLEQQISRLSDSKYEEVRTIAESLRQSCTEPPYDLRSNQLLNVLSEFEDEISKPALEAISKVIEPRPAAPTLVKYAKQRDYDLESRKAAVELYREYFAASPVDDVPPVQLVNPICLEVEMLSTMLYEVGSHSYGQIIKTVSDLPSRRRSEMIEFIHQSRGRFDELRRTYASGYRFQFDILMDIGGFRDMHRHRRCIQIIQNITAVHGFATPKLIIDMNQEGSYVRIMNSASEFWSRLQQSPDMQSRSNADYVLPLGFKRRSLFKMDFAEAAYICELRTGPAGHFSYRDVAYGMYEEIEKTEPQLARLIRVTKPHPDDNILKR